MAFPARYSGRTRQSYRADLRQFLEWTATIGVDPLVATELDIELHSGNPVHTSLARWG